MSKTFRSDAFIFAPTAIAAALVRAGADVPMTFSRTPKLTVGVKVGSQVGI